MKEYLRSNGPWSQLVLLNNIALRPLANDSAVNLNSSLRITPLQVPHRDEYSETVGFRIESGARGILFIPDIDKWSTWNRNLAEEIKKSDMALLDGTFFANGELPGRDMKEIPHPFVTETMELLAELPASEKNKIVFIHFNRDQSTDPAGKERDGQCKSAGNAGGVGRNDHRTIKKTP